VAESLVSTRASVRRVYGLPGAPGIPGWEGVIRQGRKVVWAAGKNWATQSIARSDAHRCLMALPGCRFVAGEWMAPPMPGAGAFAPADKQAHPDPPSERTAMTASLTYTDRLFTVPGEHTLGAQADHIYECLHCAALGYHHEISGEVFAYHTCARRSGHIWAYMGTRTPVFWAGEADFAYVTHPQARGWAQAHAEAVTGLTAAVAEATAGCTDPEALVVIAWVAAAGYPGDSDQQLREIHFQVMARRGSYDRAASEALDRALTPHLPLPATVRAPAADQAAGLEATYLHTETGTDGALQPIDWDPLTLRFRPVAWQCDHGHDGSGEARECADLELRRRRGITDPDRILNELLRIASGPADAASAAETLARAGELIRELDDSLHRWGRFPSRWMSGRWMLDGQRQWKLSRKPGSGPKNLRAILEFTPEDPGGVPCMLVPDGEYAVDTVERLNAVYKTGRREAWNERT
jgi:hypothetical protein